MTNARLFLSAIAGLVTLAGCQSTGQIMASEKGVAIQTAVRRGQFELSCPNATGTILSRNMLQPVLWASVRSTSSCARWAQRAASPAPRAATPGFHSNVRVTYIHGTDRRLTPWINAEHVGRNATRFRRRGNATRFRQKNPAGSSPKSRKPIGGIPFGGTRCAVPPYDKQGGG